MPGQGGIQVPEHAVPGHEGLTGAAFFTGAAVENHGALEQPCLDGLFYRQGPTEGGGTQQIVAAALAVAALRQAFLSGGAGNLGEAGKGIKFP